MANKKRDKTKPVSQVVTVNMGDGPKPRPDAKKPAKGAKPDGAKEE